MNILKSLLLVICLPLSLWAQSVDIDKSGLVKVNGKEAFKIEGKQGIASTQFSVYNLDGELLVSGQGAPGNSSIAVTFTGSNASLDFPLTIGSKKVFAKDIALLRVIDDGKLNMEGVKRMVAKYNGRADQSLVLTDRNTQNNVIIYRPLLVPRNRTAHVYINNDKISQDNKFLGTISHEDEPVEGNVVQIFKIYNANNEYLATAYKKMNERQVEIQAANEGVYSETLDNPNIDIFSLQQFIVDRLIQNNLL